MNNLTTQIKTTKELSSSELLAILKARVDVFVVEQNCPYPEIDDKDIDAIHVILTEGEQLVAYARIIPHDDGTHLSFGRVLVVKEFRNQQLGHQLVAKTIETIHELYPHQTIKISAQNYIKQFYASFGFVATSDVYLEDDIPHLDMELIN